MIIIVIVNIVSAMIQTGFESVQKKRRGIRNEMACLVVNCQMSAGNFLERNQSAEIASELSYS